MVHLGQFEVLLLNQLDIDRLGRIFGKYFEHSETFEDFLLHQGGHLAERTVLCIIIGIAVFVTGAVATLVLCTLVSCTTEAALRC